MAGAAIPRRLVGAWTVATAWLVATVTVASAAQAAGYAPWDPATWARNDSALYIAIVHDGYTLFRCQADSTQWCGNAGWFPGYPWLIALFRLPGLPAVATGMALSWAFSLGTLVLLWACFLGRRVTAAAFGALAYAAFAPGVVYAYAVYPLSMLAFFTVAHFALLRARRWTAAGLAGAAAAVAYPFGGLLAAVSGVWLLAGEREAPLTLRLRRCLIVAGLTAAGAALVALVQKIEVGRWGAYFLVQDKYRHGLQQPFKPLQHAVHELTRGSPVRLEAATSAQTVLVTAVLLCVFVEVAIRWAETPRLDRLLGLWALTVWLVMSCQTHLSLDRSQAALAPIALLVRRLPAPLVWTLAGLAAWISVPMTELYVRTLLL